MDDSAFGGQAFGGGLDFSSSPAPTSGGEAGAVGGGSVAGGEAPPPSAPAPSMFGSGIYRPAPTVDPLDIAENQLQQRIEAAQRATTGPGGAILGLFNPEARQHNLALIPQATEAIQKIREQKAALAANRQQAETLGLAPGEVPDQATQEQRVTFAKAKALRGDLKTFQGLAAVDPKAAESIADRVYEATGAHLKSAQYAYDKLSMMSTAGEYNAAIKEMRSTGVLAGIEALGFKVPEGPQGFMQFNAMKAQEGQALRDATIHMQTIRQKLEDRNTYQPMEKKEAETYAGRLTTEKGDVITNGVWGRNGAMGTRGFIVNGMADPRELGKSFTLGDNAQRKELAEAFGTAVPKEELEKYRAFNRTYDLATKDKDGNVLPPGKINDNPNVKQGIAEGLASMLRGGSGGANVGLLNIELKNRGWTQAAADAFTSNYNGIWNVIEGKQVAPYLTGLTQTEIRDVMDVLHDYNAKSVQDRVGRIAERAGALGFDSSVFGLGRGESAAGIDDAMERGRQAQIARMMPQHQAIGGGDGVLQLGAQRPGAGNVDLPPGASPTNQLPSTPALRTPVQQAGQPQQPNPPPAPAGPQPGPSAPAAVGGGPVPAPPGPAPSTRQGQPAQGAAGSPPPGPSSPGPGGGAPAPMQPRDPVRFAMDGVAGAVHTYAAVSGEDPKTADAQIRKLVTNKRVEEELQKTGQVTGPTVAKALGKGTDKGLVAHLTEFLTNWFNQGAAPEASPNPSDASLSPEERKAATAAAAGAAPAVGGMVGAAVGSVAPGAGTVAGGAAGSGVGQVVKDYLQGNEQSPREIAKQTALGGVLGVAGPAGRPLVGAAARALGVGGIEAADKAIGGGNSKEVFEAGAKGMLLGATGEAFGRALGMAGHKLFSLFGENGQKAVYNAAKDYAEGTRALETMEPKIAGANGTVVPNPKYAEAEAAVQKAETVLKDAGVDPSEAAYAYKVTAEDAGRGKAEALVRKPGELEQQRVGEGYQQLEKEIGAAGVGAPKAAPKLPDGPISLVQSGAVSKAHAELAQRTEMAITAPAANWQEKWTQLKAERTKLLDAEREAMTSTVPGRGQIAKDMRALADTVRVQQEKAAKYVFGEKEGEAFIGRLKVLDTRYRNLMEATNGGDMLGAAKLRGEDGRRADKAFRAFAMGDKDAIAAWDALRKRGSDTEKDVKTLVAAEKIPVLGHLISAAKLLGQLGEWRAARAAGDPVKFGDLLKAGADDTARQMRDFGASAVTRGLLQ